MTDETGVVEIHGKMYRTVALRIELFWKDHPEWSITSKVLSAAELIQIKTTIRDTEGRVMSTGLAEEMRGSTNINKTSALENAETSAVGRALAFLGYGGTSIASAEELAAALEQQRELEQVERLKLHNAAVRDNIESIVAIKTYLANDEYGLAYEAYNEMDNDTKTAIKIAPTKGGIFTTGEAKQIGGNEWAAARKAHHGEQT